ncbi:hypothetical protein CALCODRAFT_228356 [Calocera cornea HHB12733]|uniref:Secreted protein n=1 Tax=Calocera cornea HHB12733 TaxID=1353952 RepID=A0A165H3F4_9BASI|nr:hypothetical protein CALCODRAFT_228356 [Calocera cornea HHB12733]
MPAVWSIKLQLMLAVSQLYLLAPEPHTRVYIVHDPRATGARRKDDENAFKGVLLWRPHLRLQAPKHPRLRQVIGRREDATWLAISASAPNAS